jgi:1-deoxy-D-xylulose-5-phosphate reductoisomerase
MGIPILYAFTYPERRPVPSAHLDLTRTGPLTFFAPDPDKFPCLRLARAVLDAGGVAPVVLNAANEIAVAAFLDKRIRFTAIPELIERALEATPPAALLSIDQCVAVDAEARRRVEALVDAGIGRR